jgi:hypothetical protein
MLRFWRELRRRKLGMVGVFVLLAITAAALAAPVLATAPP